jgi:hypothetical protein
MIQQYHSKEQYTPKGMGIKLLQRHLHTHVYCSTIYNSQAMENRQDVPLLMNGLRNCGIYTQWNFTQPQRMKFCHSQSKWMELENIILSEVSQAQKIKNCMFSLICGL